MDEENPVHSSELEVNGEYFCISVYSSAAGRYFAKTCLGDGDVIITDGRSLDDALATGSIQKNAHIGCRLMEFADEPSGATSGLAAGTALSSMRRFLHSTLTGRTCLVASGSRNRRTRLRIY